MLHSEVFVVAGLAGSAMLFWVAKDLFWPFKKAKKKSKGQKQTIVLDTISVIWSKRKEAILNIEELSLLWRSIKSESDIAKEDIKFYSEIIEKFFKEHIEGKLFFTGNTKKVILNLLILLDTEGNVSSLVSGQQDTESKIPQETFKKLYNVSLIEHTINVAEEIIQLIPYGPMVPKGIIAALGHDIGKIPKYRQQYYALGDHPFISVNALELVPDFKNLIYADDVLKAVRDHHLKPKDKLGEYLKEADQRARRKELSKVNNTILSDDILGKTGDPHVSDIASPEALCAEPQTTEVYQTVSNNLSNDHQTINQTSTKQQFPQTKDQTNHQTKGQTTYQTVSNGQNYQTKNNIKEVSRSQGSQESVFGFASYMAGVDTGEDTFTEVPEIFGGDNSSKGEYKYERMKNAAEESSNIFISTESKESQRGDNKPKKIPLDWLDLMEFLNRIRVYINKVDENGAWKAFSMPNGVVYVLPDLIFAELKGLAEELGVLDLDLASSDKSIKRDYIYSVLCRVRDELDGIETSLIRDGYFSAPFILEDKEGNRVSRALYVPFKAHEAFGKDLGSLEVIKSGKLTKIARVYPPQKE
ncbi:HD domain-containing protein [Thermodesulfovibrio sp. 1176]|uniref:HD domain-containing protein n=1 Tax=Thermodesulfovibrio sp. 1176 TaxID=3043424 RepID=UPI0024826183|nr:HD domain-containing protein [Thermodesulfovibrio sp. 1176]MDI1472933.1 HD domain-containing protein [Thermodesulfovibrio sp. 1176]